MNELYLDYAASAPMFPEVVQTVAQAMLDYPGNPASIHGAGLKAAQLLGAAREQVGRLLGVRAAEVVFTSGGTESNQLALRGVCEALAGVESGAESGAILGAVRNKRRRLITTAIEHSSVHECVRLLAERKQIEVVHVPVDGAGRVDVADIERVVDEHTLLVSIAHANGEVGVVQPIAEIGSMLRRYPHVLFHVDAAQTIGKLPVQPALANIDLLSGSAHKFHGPRGIGFLYVRSGVRLQPQLVGGNQQAGMRAGSESPALAAGMAKAFRLSMEQYEQPKQRYAARRMWRERLCKIDGLVWTETEGGGVDDGYNDHQAVPHIVHFTLPGYRAEVVVRALSERGMCVSSQSACSSQSGASSRVLRAMGKTDAEARSGIRVSFGAHVSEQDVRMFCEMLIQIMRQLVKD